MTHDALDVVIAFVFVVLAAGALASGQWVTAILLLVAVPLLVRL